LDLEQMQLPFLGKVGQKKPVPWLIGLLAAGAIAVPGGAYLVSQQLAPKENKNNATVPVEAKTVTARISASGEVQPMQTVNLSPKAAGRVAQLLVDQGDRVSQGQVVARMDDSDLQAERIQAEARVAEAQANLDKLRAGTRVEEIQQGESEVNRAQGELERVRGQVADAESALEFARKQTQRQLRTLLMNSHAKSKRHGKP
jgi:HlyD family secretion protein